VWSVNESSTLLLHDFIRGLQTTDDDGSRKTLTKRKDGTIFLSPFFEMPICAKIRIMSCEFMIIGEVTHKALGREFPNIKFPGGPGGKGIFEVPVIRLWMRASSVIHSAMAAKLCGWKRMSLKWLDIVYEIGVNARLVLVL